MDTDGDYSRVPSLWFDDGTLVIRSQKTLFKVHRSILSARSSVFRDMLAFPQSNSGTETFEDCLLVEMPDEPGDVLAFFLAIYDSSYFMPPPNKIDLSTLLGILRLSHKYDIEYLFRRALAHLDGHLHFEEYNFLFKPRQGTITVPDDTDSALAVDWDPSSQETSSVPLIGVIQALTAVEAQWLLPVARYWLSSMPLETLIKIPSETLDGDALRQILRSRETLVRQRGRIVLFLSAPDWEGQNVGCENSELCDPWRSDMLVDQFRQNVQGGEARMLDNLDTDGTELCSVCLTLPHLFQFVAWARLPDMFDLPPWESLKAQRKTVLGL
ncbi:hypothetical protein C8F01DRAFT_1137677 [Mycena amicta]|nr:hypothetical protein C8F01DRAFT_1137677 [Mycena amicta]